MRKVACTGCGMSKEKCLYGTIKKAFLSGICKENNFVAVWETNQANG